MSCVTALALNALLDTIITFHHCIAPATGHEKAQHGRRRLVGCCQGECPTKTAEVSASFALYLVQYPGNIAGDASLLAGKNVYREK